jgi:hypothetical protein
MSAPRSPLGLLLLLVAGYSHATNFSVAAFEVGGPTRPTPTRQGSADRQAVIEVRTVPGVYQVRSKMPNPPTAITTQTVIQWVKSGYSADYILSSIKHAPQTQFDLSPAEVLKLRREGVSDKTLKAMKESQQGPRYGIQTRVWAIITAASMLLWLPFLFIR